MSAACWTSQPSCSKGMNEQSRLLRVASLNPVRQKSLQTSQAALSTHGQSLRCDSRRGKQRQALVCTAQQPNQSLDTDLAADIAPDKRGQVNDLDRALSAVNEAFRHAEDSLQHVDRLPSARPPRQVPRVLRALRVAAQMAALIGMMVASHTFGWPVRLSVGAFAGAAMGLLGYRKGSLSSSGAAAAALVGGATFSTSLRAALVLLTFYWTSSKLTTYCEDRKLDDESFKKGGQRDWKQVACNGFVPTVLAVACGSVAGGLDLPLVSPHSVNSLRLYTSLAAAFLGYYSSCCGDTWASEVGQLSKDTPRLITSFRPVRKGTNGGITRLGLLASGLGGLCMGVTFYLASLLSPTVVRDAVLREAAIQQYKIIIPFGLVAGLLGSLVDSVLGATLQFTGYNRKTKKITSRLSEDVTPISGLPILDNNAVNFVSASITAAASAAVAPALFSI